MGNHMNLEDISKVKQNKTGLKYIISPTFKMKQDHHTEFEYKAETNTQMDQRRGE